MVTQVTQPGFVSKASPLSPHPQPPADPLCCFCCNLDGCFLCRPTDANPGVGCVERAAGKASAAYFCWVVVCSSSLFPAFLYESMEIDILPFKCLLHAVFPCPIPLRCLFAKLSLRCVPGTSTAVVTRFSEVLRFGLSCSPPTYFLGGSGDCYLLCLRRDSWSLSSAPGHVARGSDHPPGPSCSPQDVLKCSSSRTEGRKVSQLCPRPGGLPGWKGGHT